jgi:hypothetical protein
MDLDADGVSAVYLTMASAEAASDQPLLPSCEGLESLRVFGRLPDTGVSKRREVGVRKASKEETAGRVRTGGGVGLWGFSAGV